MAIHEWPVSERPRERLLEQGASHLSEAELLAVILGSGVRGKSAVDVGRALLSRFGSLGSLLAADARTCLQEMGVGPARLAKLHAALELARRHFAQNLGVGLEVRGPEATEAFLVAQLHECREDVFACVHLDARHRVIAFERLLPESGPREILHQVLRHNSAAVVLAHRCADDAGETSELDSQVIFSVRSALAAVDVPVLDYVVLRGVTRRAA